LPDVRSCVVRNLNERFTRLTGGITSNVLDQIRAQSLLSASVESPPWIDAAKGWPADEVLSTPSGLVHLPSFVEGRETYLVKPTPMFDRSICSWERIASV
jgi:hypothetical protein